MPEIEKSKTSYATLRLKIGTVFQTLLIITKYCNRLYFYEMHFVHGLMTVSLSSALSTSSPSQPTVHWIRPNYIYMQTKILVKNYPQMIKYLNNFRTVEQVI